MSFEIAEAFVTIRPDVNHREFQSRIEQATPDVDAQVTPQVDEGDAHDAGMEAGDLVTKGIGAAILLNGAREVAPAVRAFLTEVFGDAAQLQVLSNKAEQVFGEDLQIVEEWAEDSAHAMGLTEAQAVGLAAGLGDLLVPLGFVRDEAAGMSTDILGLSGALAEWSGGQYDASQVADILTKAMLGEREQLKALGININQAEVDTAAAIVANERWGKSFDELTLQEQQQAEALATQQLIMGKSTDAQDAYADGAASLTRSQAELTAKMDEGKEMLARGMLPVLDATLGLINAMPGPMGSVVMGFVGLGGAVTPMVTSLAQVAIGFKVAGVSMSSITGPIMSVITGFGALVASAVKATVAVVAAVARQVAAWVALAAQAMAAAARVAMAWLISLGPIAIVIAAVVALVAIIVMNWDRISQVIGAGWEWVKTKTAEAWEWIKDTVAKVGEWIVAFFMRWNLLSIIIRNWDSIKDATSKAWEAVKGVIRRAISGITGAVSSFVRNLVDKFTEMKDGVIDRLNAMLDWVTGLPGRIISAIGDLGGRLFQAGKDAIQGFWDGMKSTWSGLTSWLTGSTDSLATQTEDDLEVSSPSKRFYRIGDAVMTGLHEGLRDGFGDVDALMGKVSPQLSGSMTASLAPQGMLATAGGGGTTINNHLHGGVRVDPRSVGELADLTSFFGSFEHRLRQRGGS